MPSLLVRKHSMRALVAGAAGALGRGGRSATPPSAPRNDRIDKQDEHHKTERKGVRGPSSEGTILDVRDEMKTRSEGIPGERGHRRIEPVTEPARKGFNQTSSFSSRLV